MAKYAVSWVAESDLAARSMYCRAGVRAKAKKLAARRTRRSENAALSPIKMTKEQLLEAQADLILAQADEIAAEHRALFHRTQSELHCEDDANVRYEDLRVFPDGDYMSTDRDYLSLALPEDLLERWAQEQGSAFGHLSLFEAKSTTTAPKFYRDDEAADYAY